MATSATTRGFTLIEVLIALVLVAITSALAASSYRNHLQRGYRVEAVHALLAVAAEQERFHLAHRTYSELLDATPGDEPPGLPVASLTPHRQYRLQVEQADAADFRVAAIASDPDGSAGDPLCQRLVLDATGRREARDADGRDTTARCW